MRRRGWRTAIHLSAGLLLLAVAPHAFAQQQQPPSQQFLEGTEAFRRVIFDSGQQFFGQAGFKALGSFDDIKDPKHTILIVFGDAERLGDIPGGLRSFVNAGGALFLATDKPLRGAAEAALRQTAGVRVSGQSIVCDRREACYHGLDYCPFIQPEPGADPDLFRDLSSAGSTAAVVASNAPSYLERTGEPMLDALAWLPEDSRLESGAVFKPRQLFLFAVGDQVGHGRVLVMGDHSIFINEMMIQRDNANVEFSYNCLNWLSDADGADPRTNVLFVEEGRVNAKFEVPLKDLPPELIDRILDFVWNHLGQIAQKAAPALEKDIQAYDERNGFNRLVLRTLGISPYGLLRILLVLLVVFVVLYGCWKIGWKARYRSDLQGPLLATTLHRLAPVGSVAEQRRQALVVGDNLWEEARDLARQCLTLGHGLETLPQQATAGHTPPRVAADGGWLRRWTMAGRAMRMWRLAYGPPVRVTRAEWPRLVREAQELRTALADGTVRFE
jgi:hypothetical protein